MKKHLFWYSVLAFTLCTGTMALSSCGDDEIEPTPGQTTGGENNEQPGNQDNDKDNDKEYENTEKANEGKMAFAEGTSLYYEVAPDGAAIRLWYNAAEGYNVTCTYKGEDKDWISNMGGDLGKAGEGNTVLYIYQNESGKQRDAYVCFNMSGGYRKVIKVHQMAKGEAKKAQALPDYARKNYWRRTDREKLGLYGPVKYYATHDEVFSGVKYHFDREGHLINTEYGSTEVYKYDSQGRLTYSKIVDDEYDYLYEEKFYEYGNTGKYVITEPRVQFGVRSDMLIPDLSYIKTVKHYADAVGTEEARYVFNGDELTITYSMYSVRGDDLDGVVFPGDTLVVQYKGDYPDRYEIMLRNGDIVGISPIEYFSNGMMKSYTYKNAEDVSSNYEILYVKENYTSTFMDYAGQMLPKSYHVYNPNANSEVESITDYTYNEHMDLVKETIVHPYPGSSSYPDDEITFTQYAYDKHGNWVSRYIYSHHGAGNRERARYIEYYDE